MKQFFLAPAVLFSATLGSASFAQSLPAFQHDGSSVTLAFNFHNNDSDAPYDENLTTQITATSRYDLGNGFGTEISLGFNQETYFGEHYSDRIFIDLNPYYSFQGGEVGLYYTAVFKNDSGGGKDQESMYGINGNYSWNDFGVEAYYGQFEDDGGSTWENAGVAFSYDITSDLTAYYSERRDLDGGSYFGLVSIGATYDLGGFASSLPIAVTAELSRFTDENTSLGDSEWKQFSLMATYSFGNGAQSIFRGVRNVDFYYD